MSSRRPPLARYVNAAVRRTRAFIVGDLTETNCQVMIERGVLTMGRGSYGDPKIDYFEDGTKARIGSFCAIAGGVSLMLGGNHRTDWVSTYPVRIKYLLPGAFTDGHPASKGDIEIGNDVWIGRDAHIMSGVTIGDGAVIAAFSVVTHDVDPYVIVAGSPARPIRTRFSPEIVDALLRIAWWDWPDEQIVERVAALCSPDIEAFVEQFDPRGPLD
jgi:chloramphenicol O-acetyltransferase type B